MEEMIAAASQAESLSQSFAVRIASFETLAKEREAQVLGVAKKYGATSGEYDQATRRTVEQATRNSALKQAREYRRTLAASSESERFDRLQALKKLDSRVVELEPLFESPVQVLSREGLGTPERSRYHEQLSAAGPRELQNYAQWAVANGNRILAAAVLSRLDALPREQRPMVAVEFANKVVGEEYKQTRDAMRRIRLATQSAINVNRDFERGRPDPTSKIALGLAKR